MKRERNRGCRRVAVQLKVDHDLFVRQPETLRGSRNDSAVRLMRHEQIEVGSVQMVPFEHTPADLLGLPDGKLENGGPILLHVVQPLVHGVVRGRLFASSGRHDETPREFG